MKEIEVRVEDAAYRSFVADLKRRIEQARHKALRTVNRQLIDLYWEIGKRIVAKQEELGWGKSVVEHLADDLRAAFPDMKGLSARNLWEMRQLYLAYRDHEKLQPLVAEIGWASNLVILHGTSSIEQREFYLKMAAAERWSKRDLERQIDSDLFTRYMLSKRHPEKALPPTGTDSLAPFKDHYVLEFLGLTETHTELQLRKAILANLRDFFLEFGRNLAFIGEEHPLTIGNDTFFIDLLFFHRELRCLVAVELKIGKFKPEYIGKMQFYLEGLDETARLLHENPAVGLILCKSKDSEQVRIALTSAGRKIGVATYETKLPDKRLLLQRLHQLPYPGSTEEQNP